jgi:uncharacterized protein YbaR (Trm112 family)
MISLPTNKRTQRVEVVDGELLACPSCKDSYLHHANVHIWQRNEDQKEGTFIVSTRDETITSNNYPMDDCPSSRRSAVAIQFWCESCRNINQLNICQHKGQTFMEWEWISEIDPKENTPGS